MKSLQVKIPWIEGLHARPASRVVRIARNFSSSIHLRCNQKIANAQSLLSILLLSASLGSIIQIEANGEDEDSAIQAVAELFEAPE